ncbi:MAG: branched-chain amino acid ABC transporter permease [Acidimicrobiales bacterium]|nr:branched-chain amino acid ABC transporter permease [Acidimicrobiales bacterium]MDG1877300.1 branched-chain amino acid ABC transporter permease [Acidimicrobiales bacterium]
MSTTEETTEILPSRDALDQDWRKVGNHGLLLGLALIFVSLANMPVSLDTRTIIEPLLSMGYLSLIWIPVVMGFVVSSEKVLEGIAYHDKGAREVAAGGLVGLIGGLGLSLLVILLDTFNLRDPLVNWSPALLELLHFDNGIGFGVVIWPVIGSGLGLFGGALHVLPSVARTVVGWIVGAVLVVAVFETVIMDLLTERLPFEFITDWFYFIRGGLSQQGAITVAIIGGALGYLRVLGQRGVVPTPVQNYKQLAGPERARANTLVIIACGIATAILPLLLGRITNELLANVGLFVLLALGLNIVVGLAGILDLGYVAFFAVGGYATAILTSPNRGESWPDWMPQSHWFVALIVVILFAILTGLFIGAPVIRMRGDYLAIVTLGFGEIIRLLFLSDWLGGYTGGAQGVTNIPGVDLGFVEIKGTDPRAVFYLVAVFCAIAIYVSWRLENSRLGRAWMAIREDESVAEAMGINTVNAKLMAFVVGAVLASFSGAIFAAKVGSVFPTSFIILVSIVILVVVIVGGMGNILGVIAGAAVLIGVLGGPKQPGLLAEFSEFKLLIYGALLIFMMLKRPEGLVPNVRRTRELHQDEFLQDAWLRSQVDADEEDGAPSGEVAPA